MRRLASGAVAVGVALGLVASCGGGGTRSATTTSSPPSSDDPTTTVPTTTSTTIDPILRDLLLVAEDLPAFKEKASDPAAEEDDVNPCDATTAPANDALAAAPTADGATFVRGADDAIEVSSEVTSAAPEQAEASLNELLEPRVLQCLETGFQARLAKDFPGQELTIDFTSSKAALEGVDQTVLLTGTMTGKDDTGATLTYRLDFVRLRTAGTILGVSYRGPTALATAAERQRIVAIAARKLADAASGGTTTTVAAGSGSSTSSTSSSRRTSTTRRSTSTTRSGETTSSSRASSTTSTTR